MDQFGDEGRPTGARVWPVGALVQAVSDSLAARFSPCVVRGEVSGFVRAASGHAYFTLKDERGQAALRCAMFRRALSQLQTLPVDGWVIEARGQLTVYEARGELQLVVESLRAAGEGALYEQFLRLRNKLQSEGLFDADRKRTITPYPRRVAVVTSLGAAALHDVLTALARRAPHVEVVVVPSLVQGPEAPPQLVAALQRVQGLAQSQPPIDACLLVRGGGSLEDLWAFNDERVVRAVAASAVPVVSGVGHETDLSLVDFAADVRAPTPTAAAEMVAQAAEHALAELARCAAQLRWRMRQRLDSQVQRVDRAAMALVRPAQALATHRHGLDHLLLRLQATLRANWQRAKLDPLVLLARLQKAPPQRLAEEARGLQALGERMARAASQGVRAERARLLGQTRRLEGLDPQRVLERGYARLQDQRGGSLSHLSDLAIGQDVVLVLADGQAQANVTGLMPVVPVNA